MDSPARETDVSLVGAAFVVEGALVVVALLVGWLFGRPPLGKIAWTLAGVTTGLLATIPMVVGLVLLDRFPFGPLKKLDAVMRKSILPLFRAASLLDLLLISLLAGLGEELLFRGVLQDALARAFGSPPWALVVASIVFGLAHSITATYVVLAALMGAYFGVLYLSTGNLLVPIVTHAAYDFVALVYLLREAPVVDPDGGDEWLF